MKKKKEIVKYSSPKTVGLDLVKELKKMENVEDLGSSIYRTNQQFYFIIQDLLRQKFGMEDKDLKDLHQELTRALEGLAWFEEKGLNPLSPYSVSQLVDVTLNHYQQFKAAKTGIILPESKEAKKLFNIK